MKLASVAVALIATVWPAHVSANDCVQNVSVFMQDGVVRDVVPHRLNASAHAVGTFENTLNTTGWGILNVRGVAGSGRGDADVSFAGGFAEGFLTAPRIASHFQNAYPSQFGKLNAADVAKVKGFLTTQHAWARAQAEEKKGTSVFWEQAYNLLRQHDGLVAGYHYFAEHAASLGKPGVPMLDQLDLYIMNAQADLGHIIPALVPHTRPGLDTMPVAEADKYLLANGRCSALIKVAGDMSELYMGQAVWYHYFAMNRIYKQYHFALQSPGVAAKRVSFSSYPGSLESLDDFYMMDSGLGMVQTSISFSNPKLYSLIKPQSLLSWQRVRVANSVATTGQEWHTLASTAFSGTYCNQYMVVNFNLYQKGKPIADGTLWVVEEIPGQMPGKDLSEILSYGYWPSYNVPYFPQVYEDSGFAAMALRGVPSAAYQDAPRANIFRRDSTKAKTLDTFASLMRQNQYQTDPYSKGSACNAICCRGDLAKGLGMLGCMDAKVTNSELARNLTAHIQSGPTRGGVDKLEPFAWTSYPEVKRPIGLPDVYDFPFITVSPRL